MDGFFNGHDVTPEYDRAPSYGYSSSFSRDPNFYHKYVTDAVLKNTSAKSYKLGIFDKVVWVPKSICREVSFDGSNKGSLYIHKEILNNILASA